MFATNFNIKFVWWEDRMVVIVIALAKILSTTHTFSKRHIPIICSYTCMWFGAQLCKYATTSAYNEHQ